MADDNPALRLALSKAALLDAIRSHTGLSAVVLNDKADVERALAFYVREIDPKLYTHIALGNEGWAAVNSLIARITEMISQLAFGSLGKVQHIVKRPTFVRADGYRAIRTLVVSAAWLSAVCSNFQLKQYTP